MSNMAQDILTQLYRDFPIEEIVKTALNRWYYGEGWVEGGLRSCLHCRHEIQVGEFHDIETCRMFRLRG